MSGDNVVSLRPSMVAAHERDNQPNQVLITKLEELLADAKQGTIVGIAYAIYHAPNDVDQQIGYNHCGRMRVVSMLGGLDMLKHEMIRDEFIREDEDGNA